MWVLQVLQVLQMVGVFLLGLLRIQVMDLDWLLVHLHRLQRVVLAVSLIQMLALHRRDLLHHQDLLFQLEVHLHHLEVLQVQLEAQLVDFLNLPLIKVALPLELPHQLQLPLVLLHNLDQSLIPKLPQVSNPTLMGLLELSLKLEMEMLSQLL